jgi:hypothetical protein
MTNHRRIRAVALGISVVAASLTLAAPAALAGGGAGATTVRGTQLALGSCEDEQYGEGYAMAGALEGCWWIVTFVPKGGEDKAHYRATGTEHFEGCLGSVCGSFDTTYSFTAKTDGPWPTSPEIHGRCHHPIDAEKGTGGFAGASGELSFHDVDRLGHDLLTMPAGARSQPLRAPLYDVGAGSGA